MSVITMSEGGIGDRLTFFNSCERNDVHFVQQQFEKFKFSIGVIQVKF